MGEGVGEGESKGVSKGVSEGVGEGVSGRHPHLTIQRVWRVRVVCGWERLRGAPRRAETAPDKVEGRGCYRRRGGSQT